MLVFQELINYTALAHNIDYIFPPVIDLLVIFSWYSKNDYFFLFFQKYCSLKLYNLHQGISASWLKDKLKAFDGFRNKQQKCVK